MRGRHWDALSRAVGTEIWPGEDLQLTRLLKSGILKHMDVLNVSAAPLKLGAMVEALNVG
jgi:hypothetical protein